MQNTLDFARLPLIRAECSLVFEQLLQVDLDTIVSLRDVVKDVLPTVAEFRGGYSVQSGAFSFSVGTGPASVATFLSPDSALSVSLHQDRLVAAWAKQSESDAYPRFGSLKDLLTRARISVASPKVGSVLMSYVNHVPESDGDVLALLKTETFCPNSLGSGLIHDLNVSYRIGDNIDYRLQWVRTLQGFLLTNTAGTRVSGDELETLDAVHSVLISEFECAITDEAKEVWKLGS